jgi:hypothetical protein
MPTTFLDFPREIRDQIYYETLFTDKLTRIGTRAEKQHDTWIAGREHLPGYYRPIKHYHKAEAPLDTKSTFLHWSHETRVMRPPALFFVNRIISTEVRELYFKDYVLLEMKIMGDCEEALARWIRGTDEEHINIIQKLHIYVHVQLVFDGKDHDALIMPLKKTGDHDIDLIDPLFRIELRDQGKELRVLTSARLIKRVAAQISGKVQKWAAQRCHPETPFVGSDTFAVAKAILEIVWEFKHMHFYIDAHIQAKDVVHVYKHEGKCEDYRPVVRLSSLYPHVITKVIAGQQDGAWDTNQWQSEPPWDWHYDAWDVGQLQSELPGHSEVSGET